MTRRALFSALAGVPIVGRTEPTSGFVFHGHLTNAGQDGEAWFAIGQHIALVMDPEKVPACVAGARGLLGEEVEVSLTRKV